MWIFFVNKKKDCIIISESVNIPLNKFKIHGNGWGFCILLLIYKFSTSDISWSTIESISGLLARIRGNLGGEVVCFGV